MEWVLMDLCKSGHVFTLVVKTARRDKKAAVAQSVEQRTENPCVGGSIPPHGKVRIEEKPVALDRFFRYYVG